MFNIKDEDKLIISIYGSHNASVVMYYKGEYTVVEVERWLNLKNAGLTLYYPCQQPQIVFDEIINYLLNKSGRTHVDVLLLNYADYLDFKFVYKEKIGFDHHTAHAATAFYQSPYEEMLVFTYDGGGNGGYFNVYTASRRDGIKLINNLDYDLGYPYMLLADHLEDIRKEPLNIGNLVYAGKLMGLCSYGKVREDWLPHFENYYQKFKYTGDAFFGGNEIRPQALKQLFEKINLEFDLNTTRFSGQIAWDIAATTQRAFENEFLRHAQPYIDKFPDLPIGLAGGCALNVLLNKRILDNKKDKKVFVPPNTNDCGIAAGGVLWYLKPQKQVDLTYSGLPILDADNLGYLINKYYLEVFENVTLDELAIYLNDGHIVGIIQGNSEHGSRALGNRSILCDPRSGMKDILNNKVKKREWYRPFAPMVRLEDAPTYFDIPEGVESRHMVFVANVRDEWADRLASVRHEDGTGRLQTITKTQNPLIYDLLGKFGNLSGHSVLLNTSFNINGKPILTRLDDAFKLLKESDLDAVYYDGKMFFKHNTSKNFSIIRKNKITSKINKDTTSVLYYFNTEVPDNIIKTAEKYIKNISKKIVFMINHEIYDKFKKYESENVKVHLVTEGRKYFMSQIYNREVNLTKMSELIKCLWFKELIRENVFNNQNHIFINLDSNNIKLKHIFKALEADTHTTVYATGYLRKEENRVYGEDFLKKRYNKKPEYSMNLDILYGDNDDLIIISNLYEAYLIGGFQEGKIGVEADYLDFPMLENEKIKIHRVD
jgi:carbamoyltransferase